MERIRIAINKHPLAFLLILDAMVVGIIWFLLNNPNIIAGS